MSEDVRKAYTYKLKPTIEQERELERVTSCMPCGALLAAPQALTQCTVSLYTPDLVVAQETGDNRAHKREAPTSFRNHFSKKSIRRAALAHRQGQVE